MILHKMMIGSGAPTAGRYWLLPGGRFIAIVDGELVAMNAADGWPLHTDMGDVFKDAQGRVAFNTWLNLGGGTGELRNVRVKRELSQQQAVRSLGQYQGFASENMALTMVDTGAGSNQFGFTRPVWFVEGGGFGFETGYTAGWPWEQQSNGHTGSGESTVPAHVQVIQDSYIARMAYPFDVCATKDLAVVLRQAASGGPEPEFEAPGRPWLGWTLDATGTKRRVSTLTPAQAKAFAGAAGFRPTPDVIVSDHDLEYGWNLLRPLGPLGDDAIAATGCLSYAESYERYPMPHEFPYYMGGIPAYGTNRRTVPLTDRPMTWHVGAGTSGGPVFIAERLYTWSFATMRVTKDGIVDLTPTGRSVARSAKVTLNQDGNTSIRAYRVFADANGYQVWWRGHPGYEKHFYRGELGGGVYLTSPNGWRTQCMIPVSNPGGVDGPAANDVPLPYMPVPHYPNAPRFNSVPPAKPTGWNDATQGTWTVPPYDVDEGQFWKGQRYWNPSTGEITYGQGPNSSSFDMLANGFAAGWSDYAPNGPYARTAKGRWYGQGSFVVAQHLLPTGPIYTSHPVTLLAPGIIEPGYTLQPYAEPDGTNPAMRLFQWPKRNRLLMMLQDGTWWSGIGTGAWQAFTDLGSMHGTTSVVANVRVPDAPAP